jgi:xylose isomerase
MPIVTGKKEFFAGIGKIVYEGPQSNNPLAFQWYDENKTIAGKTMKDHLRFACAQLLWQWWRSFWRAYTSFFME